MTFRTDVYVAGVGLSPSPQEGSPAEDFISSLVSAATKALLDAGVTYDDISRSVTSTKGNNYGYCSEACNAFDEEGPGVAVVGNGLEFDDAFHRVSDRGDRCVLMLSLEKSDTVALVLVSDGFLRSHPYLKNSSVLARESDDAPLNLQVQELETKEGLSNLCRLVWTLRGWSHGQDTAGKEGSTIYRWKGSGSYELSRADAKPIPRWETVEYKHDGKHRLGYNPAAETRDISQEDFEAIRTSGKGRNGLGKSNLFNRRGGDRAALSKL